MQGKKTRFPFDHRFEVTGKHANRKKPKHEQTQKLIARHRKYYYHSFVLYYIRYRIFFVFLLMLSV